MTTTSLQGGKEKSAPTHRTAALRTKRPFAFSDVSRLQVARFNAKWYALHLIGKGGSVCL
ncbi:hypothetical protein EJ066_29450 [Mesorhizobium sp. M9A.F.Ca.ET.002.03.1.2]|nr:hypothetical protein EJ066_29450 [Mesorhizobium sp. M9A.F.Ca.ET.002.03.1.2]